MKVLSKRFHLKGQGISLKFYPQVQAQVYDWQLLVS